MILYDRKPSPLTAILFIFFAFFMQMALSLVPIAEEWYTVFSAVFSMGVYGLPALLYYQTHAWQQAEGLRLVSKPSMATCVYTVLAAIFAALFLSMLLSLWEIVLSASGMHLEWLVGAPLPQNMLIGIISMAMIPAVCEELLFRGLLFPSMERLGVGKAIALSGLVFAFMHGNIVGLPAHLLMGLVLALLTWGTNSLWISMLFHFSYNAFLTWLSYGIPASQEAISYVITTGDVADLIVTSCVLLILWALCLWQVLRHGGVQTLPVQRRRPHRLFWVALVALLLLQLANYALQIGALLAIW